MRYQRWGTMHRRWRDKTRLSTILFGKVWVWPEAPPISVRFDFHCILEAVVREKPPAPAPFDVKTVLPEAVNATLHARRKSGDARGRREQKNLEISCSYYNRWSVMAADIGETATMGMFCEPSLRLVGGDEMAASDSLGTKTSACDLSARPRWAHVICGSEIFDAQHRSILSTLLTDD
jgi:hypothetical protein